MKKLQKEIETLADRIVSIRNQKAMIVEEVVNACLKIVELAKMKKISKAKADQLFGYFLHDSDLLPNELHDVILDGASLELPKKWLEGRPEVSIRNIKEKLLKIKANL